ncbi:MAG: TonB family protein [Prevotellaceae bacterium]|jgi:TonB family protein|nr:TonB family protein [Prevotellaceae bacterium]
MSFNFHSAVSKLGEAIHKHQAGLYVTIIFHLLLAIAFMGLKIHGVETQSPLSIEMDYSQEEEQKMLEELQREKQNLEAQVNQMLGQTREQLRNVAVNEAWREEQTERSQVLNENDELQKKIEATRKMLQQPDAPNQPAPVEKPKKEELYTGPSVMSWKLDGRSAYSLPVPVYQCEAGGTVVVNITVAQRGNVASASVAKDLSASNICLHEAAMRAAMLSKFSPAESSKPQQGTITYSFIAQ